MIRAVWIVLALAVACALPEAAAAQSQPLILVVDVSGSMADDDGAGTTKIDGAKLALLDYIGGVEAGSLVGLRTYPDQSSGGCNAGREAIPLGAVNPETMSAEVRKLTPDGDTPTAEALRAAYQTLKDSGKTRGTLVLVSDGESTCADPCEAAKEISADGFEIDAITVGFKISDGGREQLECISEALDGRYLDVGETDDLRDALDKLGRPRMAVKLKAKRFEAVAGGDYTDVAATITNDGEVEARGVVGQFNFKTSEGFDVRRPVVHLGNLAPHGSQTVTWRVRADAAAGGKTRDFTIVGRAVNASATGEAAGTVAAVGVTKAEDAGAIIKGPGQKLAILGDSYSAGEGADAYVDNTDSQDNSCHRSDLTYLKPIFEADNLACSGAVSAQVWGPPGIDVVRKFGGETAQVAQLAERQRKGAIYKAVVMTIGGNDAGFPMLAKSCLFGAMACSHRVHTNVFWQPATISLTDFEQVYLGDSLSSSLQFTYVTVNQTLNTAAEIKRRGGVAAPILVLGYPLPVPLRETACGPMGVYRVQGVPFYLLDGAEIEYAITFLAKLNGIVEAAVLNARNETGAPVFYVPPTETAFLPRHTACDSGKAGTATEPFARSVSSINGAGVDAETIQRLMNTSTMLAALKQIGERSAQEIAHPNVKGYDAETLAVLRWTQSRDAQTAVAFTRKAVAAKGFPTSWDSSQVNLGPGFDIDSYPDLYGGTTYPLTVLDWAPDSDVRLTVESTPRVLAVTRTDSEGRVDTRIALPPDLERGDHTLVLAGADPKGGLRTVRIPIKVKAPFRPRVATAVAFGSLASLLLSIPLLVFSGQARRWRRRLDA